MATLSIGWGYNGQTFHKHGRSIMWLKLVILALLLAIVVSLFSGLFFLVKDVNGQSRLVTALSVRIALTVTVMLLIAYGFWSGQFTWNTPWLH
jgi:hypothetical protein|tara:strand:- start:24327 stop:24605 length:279 start_codon:yes stop_codon:yes gene_type:complete